MKLKIIDEAKIKKAHKIRDDSFKKYCEEIDKDKIEKIVVVRNPKGELTLWEVYHKPI
jgi:hypothetical protein|tara:strand:- start:446 stop:619 length:174 start_codon:yes stop_codon:yes gene_type:complete